MGQAIFVPIEGQHITQSGDGPQQPTQAQERPAWAKRSMHAVKFPRREVEYTSTWEQNGPTTELKWREAPATQPAERPPVPEAHTSPQSTQSYQPQGNYMDNQFGNDGQAQGGAQPPNPADYDIYDSNDVARFHSDNATYYSGLARREAEALLSPHMDAMREAALQRDYNAALARYGNDANFRECMDVALKNCAEADKSGKPFDIVEEYQRANDKTAARPGVRGNAHLPAEFRDKRRGISCLGRIMEHNRQTGRGR